MPVNSHRKGDRYVGKCWACVSGVKARDAVWMEDYSVTAKSTGLPVRRLAHRGGCAERVAAVLSRKRAEGVKPSTQPAEKAHEAQPITTDPNQESML